MPSTFGDVKLNAGHATDEIQIRQISSLNHSTNETLDAIRGSGGVVPLNHFQSSTAPASTLTTTDSTVLLMNNLKWLTEGYCADIAPSVLPFYSFKDCASINTAAVHTAFSSGKTFVLPTSISGTESQPIEIGTELRYLAAPNDPFTSPITTLSNQAYAAGTFAQASQLGKIFVGGAEIPELISFTYTPGFTVVSKPTNGGTFHNLLYVSQLDSTFEIVTEDLNRAISVLNAASITAAGGMVLYLAKKLPGAAIEPFADAKHISITALAGLQQTPTISVQSGSAGSGTIKVTLSNPTGVNNGALVTVANNVVIP